MNPTENIKKQPPNIVFILTDDQGFGDLNLHGNNLIDTLEMDKLAKEGVRFNHFYVSPLCAPSRASILTGRYHPRTGVLSTEQNLETLNANEVTIAQGLKQHGYKTACFGKWHNGCFFPHTPMGMGFDEFLGFYGGFFQNYFDPVLINHENESVQTKGYITDILTDYALNFISRHKNQPFFCYIPYNACHTPIQCPDELFKKYKKLKLDNYNAGIYAMLENVDYNLGRIKTHLKELDLLDNTIIIFLSDNGANMLPPLFKRYNANLRGWKGTIHEGGNRVPMFMSWSKNLEPGLIINEISAHIDLLPTIFELCKLPIPKTLPLDGKSLVPLLKRKGEEWPERYIFTHFYIHRLSNLFRKSMLIIRGLIKEFFKNFWRFRSNPKVQGQKNAIKNMHKKIDKTQILIAPGAVRTPCYRLAVFLDNDELYDIIKDPSEKENIIEKHPEIAQKLRSAYDDWFYSITPENQKLKKIPIPIGYEKASIVDLPASHCKFHGKVRFAGFGFYNDWITNWKRTKDYVSWEINVIKSALYEISLIYSCKKKYIGSKIRLEIGDQTVEALLNKPFKSQKIKRADRVIRYEQYERTWAMFTIGKIYLNKGRTTLNVKAIEIPKKYSMDLYSVRISLLKGSPK